MPEKPQVRDSDSETEEQRQVDFERRVVTDYSQLPPAYREYLEDKMREASRAQEKRAS